jgi:hypothetical protein
MTDFSLKILIVTMNPLYAFMALCIPDPQDRVSSIMRFSPERAIGLAEYIRYGL